MTWKTSLVVAGWTAAAIALFFLLDSPRVRPFIGASYVLLGLLILIRDFRTGPQQRAVLGSESHAVQKLANGIGVMLIGASLLWGGYRLDILGVGLLGVSSLNLKRQRDLPS